MNSTTYFQNLIYSFLILFGVLLVCGIVLTAISVNTVPVTPTTLDVSIKGTQLVFRASTGIPGIILVILGSIGLLTLLIKIPVKEVIHVISGGGKTGRTIGLMIAETRSVDHNLPVLLYWILKKRMNLSRAK